jgi:2-methylcitrate dehydratase PrpD
MVAVPLLQGTLTAADYEDDAAADPRIDALRAKMEVVENADYTRDYLDPAKRSIGNAVQVFFSDGSATQRVAVEYPVGHRRRRAEGVPLLLAKFERALRGHFSEPQAGALVTLCADRAKLEATPVQEFMSMLALPVTS